MTQNTPESSEDAVQRPFGTPHSRTERAASSDIRGIVATIPVDSIRGRVMTDVSHSLRDPERTAAIRRGRMKRVLSCDSPETALAAIRNAHPKAETPKRACVEFINELRLSFSSLDKRDFEKNWQNLKNDPVFESATIEYLGTMVPNIFKNKYNRSLYEDIEFGLFLLGSSASFDILGDIRVSGMSGMTELFTRRHTLIIREQTRLQDIDQSISQYEAKIAEAESSNAGREAELYEKKLVLDRKKSERTKVAETFERKVSSFEQLCEIVNKIAAMQSISALDKDRALSLIRMIAAQIATVGEELEQSEYDPFARNKLRFIEGKLLGNYSHLEFFDGKTPIEIIRKADRICESIERGFELQQKTDFWWKPERENIARSVIKGNIAFVRLTALQKIKEIGKLDFEQAASEKKYLRDLFDLYAEMAMVDEPFDNVESVALDFISKADHEEFMIETMHHLLLFCDVPVDTLCKVATKLIGDNQYNNAFHEEFKIKLFSVILEKFRNAERSDRTVKIALWIREYAKKNEKVSGLVMSFSQIYISLAIFLSSLPDRESKKSAVECYLRASRVTDETWKLKFHKHESAFLEGIGGKAELEHLEELLSVTKISNIQSELLELTTKTVKGKEKQGANVKVCEIIEEFFFGICTAEIRMCDCGDTDPWMSGACEKAECASKSAASTILRGNDHVQIPLWLWYYLVLQFPANLKTLFENILEQRKNIIIAAISNILSIVTQDREKTEANLYLSEARAEAERRRLTDELTGLPNKQAYKDDLPLYSEMADVASILVKIENLREVGQSYWMRTGEKFVKWIIDGPIEHFFTSNPDHWKAYSMSEDEILIIGDYHASPDGMPFIDIIPHLRELFSSFAFYPESSESRTEEKDGLCLRAIVSMGCSDQISTDIYEKLTIALQDTVDWPGIVFYEEKRHSEEIILANIRGASLISEALKENRVVPHYQAIVDNRTGKVVKYECLARIVQNDGTIIPPSSFVDHAKRAGTIPLITRMIFSKACRDLRGTNTHFSFNISWQDLADQELIPELTKVLEENGIDPSRVTCEILEEALLVNRGEYVGKIAALKKAGCKIALDDFGSEWSNFSRFEKDWWPDVIKIDGPSFIKGLDKSPEKQRIVRAIVKAWRELGCELVAERVDSEAIWDIVTEMGIQYSQGYLFHEPQWFVVGEPLKETIDVEAIRRKTRDAVSLVDPGFTKS